MATAQTRPQGPGFTKDSAIEVCNPAGERAYFDRLRCSDGVPLRYKRTGSYGSRNETRTKEEEQAALDQMMSRAALAPGEKDFHVVDGYEVRCGHETVMIYADMYHCPEPESHAVPPGFTLEGG